MSCKIVFIGAGSIGFTRKLVKDLLTVEALQTCQITFTDIDSINLERTRALCQRDIDANNIPLKLTATVDRKEALAGANYIFNVVRVGGLEAFATDVEIPLTYGIDQCVGDTLGPGGIMYGQRNIPVLLEFCKDIREVSAPDAILLNYANPMAMNTWACNTYGKVNTIGLCHGVYHGHTQIVKAIEAYLNQGKVPTDPDFTPVALSEVEIFCSGINHQTWYTKIRYQGEDWTSRLYEAFQLVPEYVAQEKVRIDMLKRFGYYSTESNGHLSEYLPWYRKGGKNMLKWVHLGNWIDGESLGYLRTCTEQRNYFDTSFPLWIQEPPLIYTHETRSFEHGSYIVEALETGKPYRGHLNRINNGCIPNLSPDAVVESPALVDKTGIHMLQADPLPAGCAAVCERSIQVQRLSVEAAISGSVDLLKQAMMLDALTGALCDPDQIWEMTDAMLVAQQAWLPQYQTAIDALTASETTSLRTSQTAAQAFARLRSGLMSLHDWEISPLCETQAAMQEPVLEYPETPALSWHPLPENEAPAGLFGVQKVPESPQNSASGTGYYYLRKIIDTEDLSLRLGICPQLSEIHAQASAPLYIWLEGKLIANVPATTDWEPILKYGTESTGTPFKLERGLQEFIVAAKPGTLFDIAIKRNATAVQSQSAAEAVQQ